MRGERKRRGRKKRRGKEKAFRLFRLSRTNLLSCKRHRSRVILTNWGAPGRSRLRAGYTRPNFRPSTKIFFVMVDERGETSDLSSPPFQLVLPILPTRISDPNHPVEPDQLFLFSWKTEWKSRARKLLVIYFATS